MCVCDYLAILEVPHTIGSGNWWEVFRRTEEVGTSSISAEPE